MSAVLNEFLNSLAQYDSAKGLEQLTPQYKTINDLRIRFLDVNSELYSIFLNRNLSEEALLQLKNRLHDIQSKKTTSAIVEKIEDGLPEKEQFVETIKNFDSISSKITIGLVPRYNLGLCPFPSLLHSNLSWSRRIIFEPVINDDDSCSLFGEELIQAVTQMKISDEVSAFAQTIDAEQMFQIVSSEECNANLPRLLTSLPHGVFSEFLLKITDQEASAINRKLLRVRDETWFAEKFKQIRENFVNVSNSQASKIDNLNRELRRVSLQDISSETIKRIEELRNETKRAWEAQQRLQILIRNIIVDRETRHLFRRELPIRYVGLIHRLSDKEEEQKFVSGCPYGIIYRIAFDDYALSDDEDEIEDPMELQNELLSVICTWIPNWSDWIQAGIIDMPDNAVLYSWKKDGAEAYVKGMENLKELQITSIKDLKSLRIFNSTMLKEYIQSKKNNNH